MLWATNYSIETQSRENTKHIAGRIIPAIGSTTAMITGAVLLDLYKVVQGFDKIEDYWSALCNVGTNYYLFFEPSPKIET